MTRDMRELDLPQLRRIVADQARRLGFATVSGAHLYGFPSIDSDVDLRGTHVLPAAEVVGLRTGPETLTRSWLDDGAEIDLVTHDIGKFCRLLLQRNGYVAEQLLSPLVVTSSELHREMVDLAPHCLTRFHAHHYLGFARTQQRVFDTTGELKPLLYTFRVLLTGLHLMRSGEVVADLRELRLLVPEAPDYLGELIAAKAAGGEHARADLVPEDRLLADIEAAQTALESAQESSKLPERATAEPALHDLVVRSRFN
jgi:predicted nucleotidyltransferase